MRYLKKLIKLFMEDKLLVLGILAAVGLVRLLVSFHFPSAIAGFLLALLLMGAMFLSLWRDKKKREAIR